MAKQKSLKKNAIYNMIRNLMNIIFPIISFPYASRILMPEGMGKVNFANSVIEYFVLVAGLGIRAYASRECAKVRDNRELLSKTAKEILFINALSTILAYVLFAVALIFVPKFSEYRVLLVVCSAKILFTTIGMDWLYTANEEYRYITMRSVFFQILSLVFLFSFIKSPDDYILYGAIGVLSSVGGNLCNLLYSRKFIDIFKKSKFELRRHIKPVLTFFGINAAGKVHTAFDSVMLGFLLADRAVGLYSAANKISLLVRQLITSITNTLMPRSSYYLENGEEKKYQEMIDKAANVSLFFSFPAAFGLYFLCVPVIILFSGEKYLEAVSAMKIIIPTILICSYGSFLGNVIITPQHKEKITLISQIIGAVLNIILNFIFIPLWGVFGAAFATLIVETVIVFVQIPPSWSFISNKNMLVAFLQPCFGSLLMYALIFVLFRNIANPAIQTALSIVTGAIVYAISMILMKNKTALMILKMFKKRLTGKKANV